MPLQPVTEIRLMYFKTVNKEDLSQAVKKAYKTYCANDPMPVSEVVDATFTVLWTPY